MYQPSASIRFLPALFLIFSIAAVSVPASGSTDPTSLHRVQEFEAPHRISFDPAMLDELRERREERAASGVQIHGSLLRLSEAYRARVADLPAASGLDRALLDEDRVLVEIQSENTARLVSDLAGMGGEPRHPPAQGLVEAWLPIDRIDALANVPGVQRIWPARLVRLLAGSEITQGLAAGQVAPWHAAGIDGEDVTIAIIDIFKDDEGDISDLQSSGDWPPNSRLDTVSMHGGSFGQSATPNPHGNAVLEITHDLAPAANYIAYDALTQADWRNAIDQAVAAGADIISASLGMPLDGIGDGTALPDSVAERVEAAEAAGVIYINAAGNSREEHWGGLYDGDGNSPGGGYEDAHQWVSGQTLNGGVFCYPEGYPAQITLSWDDWDNVDHDYDLFLLQYNDDDSEWQIVADSTFFQDGGSGQTPQEFIFWQVTDPTGGLGCPVHLSPLAVMVARWDAPTDRNLRLFTNLGELQHFDPASSLGYPADSPAAVTVGALNVNNSEHEYYSAEGPILAPGGGVPTGSEYPKPDITSFARVDTVSYGPGGFAGTSAAAPHVAGMMALLKQRFPEKTHADLIDLMHQVGLVGANDLGDEGFDSQHGYGRLRFQLEEALLIADQPADVEIGETIPAVAVEVRDEEGLLVIAGPTEVIDVSIANDPSSGTAQLSGTTSKAVDESIAVFDDLSIDTSGEGYTLQFTSNGPGPVASESFDVFDTVPAALAFVVQPSETKINEDISPAVVVHVVNDSGERLTGDQSTEVQLTLVNGPGGAGLSGGGPLTVTNGEAIFDNLQIDLVGTGYQIEASDVGDVLATDVSETFEIIAGDPASLAFVQQPSNTVPSESIEPPVEIEVLDSEGNRVTWDSSTQIDLTLIGGDTAANLSGGDPIAVQNGLVEFPSLQIDLPGTDYRLQAADSADELPVIESTLFDVIANQLFQDRFEEAQ